MNILLAPQGHPVVEGYRRLQNVCNRKVKSEKATAFLIRMILLFSVVRLTTISEQSEPRFCFSVAYILQSPVEDSRENVLKGILAI